MNDETLMSSLERTIFDLCLMMKSLWGNPQLLHSPSKTIPKTVHTSYKSGALILPKIRIPVRGAEGVGVDIQEGKLEGVKLAEYWVEKALFDPRSYGAPDPEIQNARGPVNGKLDELFSMFAAIKNLPERLFESTGFKHYESEDVHKIAPLVLDERHVIWKLRLSSAIGRALHGRGFASDRWEEFEDWAGVAQAVACDFEELASRTRNGYEALICLNSPLVDEHEAITIASLELAGEPVFVRLSAATDETLAILLWNERQLPVDQINTIISYKFSVDVEGSVENYLSHYASATTIAEKVTDVLRLICEDDIGVIGLEIRATAWATPSIRKTYERLYRLDLAPYQPKRFRFNPPTGQALEEEQIERLCKLAPRYLCDESMAQGLGTAMRRFRASFERYDPSDPERILEMTIALEAVLLNDAGEKQELSYRLRLRAARLLSESLEERGRIFEALRELYSFRSRIAHGETLQGIKPKDQERLDKVIQDAPRILRSLLLKLMEDESLRELSREDLASWWRKLELS